MITRHHEQPLSFSEVREAYTAARAEQNRWEHALELKRKLKDLNMELGAFSMAEPLDETLTTQKESVMNEIERINDILASIEVMADDRKVRAIDCTEQQIANIIAKITTEEVTPIRTYLEKKFERVNHDIEEIVGDENKAAHPDFDYSVRMNGVELATSKDAQEYFETILELLLYRAQNQALLKYADSTRAEEYQQEIDKATSLLRKKSKAQVDGNRISFENFEPEEMAGILEMAKTDVEQVQKQLVHLFKTHEAGGTAQNTDYLH